MISKYLVHKDGSRDLLAPVTYDEFVRWGHWTGLSDIAYADFLSALEAMPLDAFNDETLAEGKVIFVVNGIEIVPEMPPLHFDDREAYSHYFNLATVNLSDDYSHLKEEHEKLKGYTKLAHEVIQDQKQYIAHLERVIINDDLYKNNFYLYIVSKLGKNQAQTLFGKYNTRKLTDFMVGFKEWLAKKDTGKK